MSKQIIDKHPIEHVYGTSLSSTDKLTTSGVPHRVLTENGNRNTFIDFTVDALKKHHISSGGLARRKKKIAEFRIKGLDISILSPYPTSDITKRGNFAEVVVAEYINASTSAELPIYKLRYNPNPDQSMKGNDVLLFDLDSEPVRIIVCESKFRSAPNKKAVTEILDGLARSHKSMLPVSLTFVSDRLYDQGKNELGEKVSKCAELFASNKLNIDYVGFLLGDGSTSTHIDRSTTTELHRLLMISLGVDSPLDMVDEAFQRLEADL